MHSLSQSLSYTHKQPIMIHNRDDELYLQCNYNSVTCFDAADTRAVVTSLVARFTRLTPNFGVNLVSFDFSTYLNESN